MFKLEITKGKDSKMVRTIDLKSWLADGWKVNPESCEGMPNDRKRLVNDIIAAVAETKTK